LVHSALLSFPSRRSSDLVFEDGQLLLREGLVAVNLGGGSRVLGDEGALAEHGEVLGQAALFGEGLDVAHQLVAGDALEGVDDPGDRKSTRLNSSHVKISY